MWIKEIYFPRSASASVFHWWSFKLVVRWQRFPQMVTRGEPERLWLLLPLHFWPHQEPTLEADVKKLTVRERQRPFRHQSLEARSPPIQHGGACFRPGVVWTPEYLRSKNLKSAEVQRAVLKGTRLIELITPLRQEIQQLSSQLLAPPWRQCECEFSLFLFTLLMLRWKENPRVGRYLYGPERDIDIPIDAVRLEHGLDCSRAEGQHGFLVLQGKHTNIGPLASHRHHSNVVKTLRLGFFINVWETDLEHTFIVHVCQGKCEPLRQHSVKPTLQDGRDAKPVQRELQKDH